LANDPIAHPFVELNGIGTTQCGIELHSLDRTHGVPLLLFVFLWITAHIFNQCFLIVYVNVHTDVATGTVGCGLGSSYIRILVSCGKHELLLWGIALVKVFIEVILGLDMS
jgi:hypothetical protein